MLATKLPNPGKGKEHKARDNLKPQKEIRRRCCLVLGAGGPMSEHTNVRLTCNKDNN
jgi:hypothetical protein